MTKTNNTINLFRIFITLLIAMVLTGCYTTRPTADSYTSPDYNGRITVNNAHFVKKKTATGIAVNIGFTVGGALAGYNLNMIQRQTENGREPVKLANAVIGAVAGASVSYFIDYIAGNNRPKEVKHNERNDWINLANNNYKFLRGGSADFTIIQKNVRENNFRMHDTADCNDFLSAYPNSICADSIRNIIRQASQPKYTNFWEYLGDAAFFSGMCYLVYKAFSDIDKAEIVNDVSSTNGTTPSTSSTSTPSNTNNATQSSSSWLTCNTVKLKEPYEIPDSLYHITADSSIGKSIIENGFIVGKSHSLGWCHGQGVYCFSSKHDAEVAIQNGKVNTAKKRYISIIAFAVKDFLPGYYDKDTTNLTHRKKITAHFTENNYGNRTCKGCTNGNCDESKKMTDILINCGYKILVVDPICHYPWITKGKEIVLLSGENPNFLSELTKTNPKTGKRKFRLIKYDRETDKFEHSKPIGIDEGD